MALERYSRLSAMHKFVENKLAPITLTSQKQADGMVFVVSVF